MTGDQYVQSVLDKYYVPRGPTSAAERLADIVSGPIRRWAGSQLGSLQFSGSYAKETGVKGASDVDLLVSLKADTTTSLRDLYGGLFALAQSEGWSPRLQNVSVGITVDGTRGDLVPGRVQAGTFNFHSLYLRKSDSWTQTNVALHIQTVKDSRRLREIRLVKIWRQLFGLDFPSLYLELFTIQALSARSHSAPASNFLQALRMIGAYLPATRIEDPSNTNNVLSEDLTLQEKERLARLARQSAEQTSWGDIVW